MVAVQRILDIFNYLLSDGRAMESKIPLLSDQGLSKTLKLIREIRMDRMTGRTARADSKMVRAFSFAKRPSADATVLSELMAVANSYYPERYDEIIDMLVAAPGEYRPNAVLTAVELELDGGRTDNAALLFAGIREINDLSRHAYIEGRMCQVRGDSEGARMHYMSSFRADPYNLSLYRWLDSVDPGFGWTYVSEIMALRKGVEVTPVRGKEGPMQELSAIYSGWMRGDRTNSMSAMQASHHYLSGDPFYTVVFAWMCVSDGRYRKAVRSYIDAVRGFDGSVAFLVEMADIQDRMGESEDAVTACRRALDLDPMSDAAQAQLAIALLHQGKIRESLNEMDAMLLLPSVDARVCARCMDSLWEYGRASDANHIYRKVLGKCSDDAFAYYLSALNANRNGNYSAARKAAEVGIRTDPDSIPCICQLAIALAGTGKVDRALEGIRAKRPVFMDDLRLLDTEKDILISSQQYDAAIELCDSILDIDPRNAQVMRDKANAYRLKGDYELAVQCYRESLNIHEDLRLFISVLEMLLDSRRTQDLCRLVDDYDDTYGSSATVWRLRGNAEYMSGMYEDAVVSYSNASAIVGNDIDIWHSRGMAEEKAGMYADAEASYDRAVILDLENVDCWISKATVQELQGNITGAIDSLNRVITVSTDNAYALGMKGRLLARLGMYKEAIYFLKQSYKQDSKNTRVLEMILKILVRQGEVKEAVKVGRSVLRRERDNYRTMIVLAEIYIDTESWEEARGMLNDAMPYISEDTANAVRCAQAYHRLMCWNDEIRIYESLLAHEPDNREYLMALAEAHTSAGDKDAAASVYSRMEALNPMDAEAAVRRVMVSAETEHTEVPEDGRSMMELAKSLVDGGRTSEAIDILRKVVDTCPDDPEQFLYAAYVMAGEGLYDESMSVIKTARGLFPADARVLYALGTLKEKHGDTAGALSAYNDAARLGMSNHDLFLAMGRLRFSMGMISPAVDALQDAVASDPEDTEARLLLAESLIRSGREQGAVTHLLTVMKSDPGNVRALRDYVTAVQSSGSEGLLAVYDNILSAERTEEDTQFFRQAFMRIGEYAKADALLPEEDPFDPEAAALEVLDTAYSDGTTISDASVYEGLDLDGDRKEMVLDLLTVQVDYEPMFGTHAFQEMERMSNETVVSENLGSIELNRVVPIEAIRHATQCASIEKMYRLQKHIEMSFSLTEVPEVCSDEVDGIIGDMESPEEETLFTIMQKYGAGIMTARMVLLRLNE